MKHTTTPRTRRGPGPARRIGRSLAFVLPVVMVLSGTLAVTRVDWSGDSSDSVLTTAAEAAPVTGKDVTGSAGPRAPHELLRDELLLELQEQDPEAALTHLQRAVNGRPSLARHCASIARALGRAAVKVYGPSRAQSYARPVCDTSFASGVAAQHG
ncbi:membrane protein [Streptomyces ruber]|uniref:Membrane protein n=2 Tax=Streptomyces TaxID=1883 RepID=A0A918ENT7_9ACTN|nr:hypothetical protein [Streptomyces ruber]GGQ37547.1 membrane protein [Streptomyces ruber]